jgi:adenylate cyclase
VFRRANILPLIFGLVCIAGLCALRIADPFLLQSVRETAFDQFQQISPRDYVETPVRVVDIDEKSLREYGQWPWPRSRIAELTERLGQMGAAAIAFDILFAEPDRLSPSRLIEDPTVAQLLDKEQVDRLAGNIPDNDKILAETFSRMPVVLGFARVGAGEGATPPVKPGFAYTGSDPVDAVPAFPAAALNLPDLEAAAAGLGSISLAPDESISVVRKVPLLWSHEGNLYPSLAIESLRVAQGVSTILVHAVSENGTLVQAIRVGNYEIPTTPDGALWMRYSRERAERYVSAQAILADEVDQATVDAITGHIVLVGTSAVGLYDIRATSVGENVPGVSVHAQLLEQVISGNYVYRSDWVDGLELFGFLLVALYVLVMTLIAGPVLSLMVGSIVATGVAIGTWLAYTNSGLLVDPTFPLGGALLVYLTMTFIRYFTSDRQKRQIRRAFSQYVAPTVLQQIEEHPDMLALGGEMRDVTVMFTDVRNFTSFSEKLPPVEVVLFLNSLLGRMSEEIILEHGTIDKFIGDSIMAFWNAPVDTPDHERDACRAALRMRDALQHFNSERAEAITARGEAYDPIAIGIGINTGEACVGNMGSQSRFDYSVIGDTVNIASRVESACKQIGFDIILSDTTADGASGMAILDAGSIELKGKSDIVPIDILVGDEKVAESAEFVRLAKAHANLVEALRLGAAGWENRIQTCRDLSRPVNKALAGFYDLIPARQDDFHDRSGVPAPFAVSVGSSAT